MTRAQRLTQVLRHIDSGLYVAEAPSGGYAVYRKPDLNVASDYGQSCAQINDEWLSSKFVLALTDDWRPGGKPVDWGIEPLVQRLKSMDSWSRDIYREVVKTRKEQEETRARSQRNERRAIAADLRPDFAKATNDIVIRR